MGLTPAGPHFLPRDICDAQESLEEGFWQEILPVLSRG